MPNTLIIDNGGYSLKVGWSNEPASNVKILPNCVSKVKSERRRPFIADQIDDCKDYSGLFYILPAQKGYIVNWETQKQVWNYMFKNKLNEQLASSESKQLILTEPYFNFKSIQENLLEIWFEEYNFDSLLLTNPAKLVASKDNQLNPSKLCALVVDSGYSFTHIVPIIKGVVRKDGIRRVDVGGKALTNHLKDIISYRQLNVIDETFVMNQCKEDTCFVSSNINKDLEICKQNRTLNTIVVDYVLPDYSITRRGFIRDVTCPGRVPSHLVGQTGSGVTGSEEVILSKEQILSQQTIRMNNERFQVPELLFYPSDAGINQIGISHAIVHSIENLESDLRSHLYKNIILIGGNVNIPGLRDRIQSDVRSLADTIYEVDVITPKDPISEAFQSAHLLANTKEWFNKSAVTKAMYKENGSSVLDVD